MGPEGGGRRASSRGISVVFEAFFLDIWSLIFALVGKIVLDILQKPPGFHTTAREPKRAQLAPTLQSHHQNSTRRPPSEEERMKMEAGEVKKKRAKFWAVRRREGPAEGGESGEGEWTHPRKF